MKKLTRLATITLVLFVSSTRAGAESIRGQIVDQSGQAPEGVMVSAFNSSH